MAKPKVSSRRTYVAELNNSALYLIANITYMILILVQKLLIYIFVILDQNSNINMIPHMLIYGEFVFFQKKYIVKNVIIFFRKNIQGLQYLSKNKIVF